MDGLFIFSLMVLVLLVSFLFLVKRHEQSQKSIIQRNEEQSGESKNLYTFEYYSLLREVISELKDISLLLSTDDSFKDKLGRMTSEPTDDTGIRNTIRYMFLYDASQIVKIIKPELPIYSLEMFSLVMLNLELNSIQSDINNDFSFSRSAFRQIRESNEYEVACDALIQISNNKDLVKVFASLKSETWLLDLKFSLPIILKYTDSPFEGKYCSALYRFAAVLVKCDRVVTNEESDLLNELYKAIHVPIDEEKINSLVKAGEVSGETIESIIKELDELTGLSSVKEEVRTLVNFINIQKKREEQGLKTSPISYHCVFTGSPGTGKTTVARIIGRIYRHLGVLKEGHLIETDRASLIGQYIGHTAPKVESVVNKALNGVLFIDEAYALLLDDEDPYGKEAVAALIKRIEDYRDNLVVIMAGYPDEMKSFIESNPGFESRFNRYIEFPDFHPAELLEIFTTKCRESDYVLSDQSIGKLNDLFCELHKKRDKSFGNARLVRNIFEQTMENQANRISGLKVITKEILQTIEPEDIPVT